MILKRRLKGMQQDEKKRLGKVHIKSWLKVTKWTNCASAPLSRLTFLQMVVSKTDDRPYGTEKWSLALDRRCQNTQLILKRRS